MATLLVQIGTPKDSMSTKSIPEAIRKAAQHIFLNCGEGVWLVGGTALAGYYAEHRRSDYIDLFTDGPESQCTAVLAVKSLQNIGATFSNEKQTPLYYRVEVRLLDHSFTIDVVLDEHLHKIGKAHRTNDSVHVADIQTLLAMKVATLISRCSEKDLFDLDWLSENVKELSGNDLIELGKKVDGGVSVETLLISIKGAILKKEACNFLLHRSKITVDDVYRKISRLQKKFVNLLLEYERHLPPTPETKTLKQAFKNMKRVR